jgi:autotransporter-associated beta strand protein
LQRPPLQGNENRDTTFTYILPSGGGSGYDLSKINLYTLWDDGCENISLNNISFSTVADPTTFTAIPGSALDFEAGANSALASLEASGGVLANRVYAIQFNFATQGNGFVGYTELEVVGGAGVGANILPTNTVVTMTSGTTFDVDGATQQIAGLVDTGASGHQIFLGKGTLTVGGDDNPSSSFSGAIHGLGGSLVKAGAGTLTLTGANDYTGVTTVTAGTLQLNGVDATTDPVAWAPVLNVGGADVQGAVEVSSKLVLDYTGGNSPVLKIDELMKASYNGGAWDGAHVGDQFRSTTAAATGLTLGWKDDPGTKQVTVMATYAGDANLDGEVDGKDVDIWKLNVGTTGVDVWELADFNYDGEVDGADVDLWKLNVGSSLGGLLGLSVGGMSQSMNVVPEPGTLALLGTGLLGLLAYAWRRSRS